MDRPYIICHMVTSIDGKVTGDFLYSETGCRAAEQYYAIHRDLHADGFACGRVTMEGSFTGGWMPALSDYKGAVVPNGDFVADENARFYALSFDRKGRLGWKKGYIEDEDPGYDCAHVVEVLTENASREYLAYLRDIGASYIIAGRDELDLPLALSKAKELFGIEKLLLEGGSVLNGAFLRAGAVDELSVVVAPTLADAADKPLFDGGFQTEFVLTASTVLEKDILRLTYKKI